SNSQFDIFSVILGGKKLCWNASTALLARLTTSLKVSLKVQTGNCREEYGGWNQSNSHCS
ncbi:MAG: hypothetical protein Q7U30_10025, partial [Methylicorpusculum sp.]|nr:hypothetical protein [Methylicorpusculum sp.]